MSYVITDKYGNEKKVQVTDMDLETARQHLRKGYNPATANIHDTQYSVRTVEEAAELRRRAEDR